MTKRSRQKEVRTPYDGLRIFSALTHGIGAWLASVGVAALIVIAVFAYNTLHVISYAVYGLTLIGLYTTSTLYHCLRVRPSGRVVLRKLDHMMIFLLIAGTYTPICLITLDGAWRWSILGVIWGLAAAGSVVTLFFVHAPRWVSSVVYLGMGWMIVIAMAPLVRNMPLPAFVMLGAGGLLYTVGAVLYALRWPGRDHKYFGFHEVFHIFILTGSVCHYVMMLFLG